MYDVPEPYLLDTNVIDISYRTYIKTNEWYLIKIKIEIHNQSCSRLYNINLYQTTNTYIYNYPLLHTLSSPVLRRGRYTNF